MLLMLDASALDRRRTMLNTVTSSALLKAGTHCWWQSPKPATKSIVVFVVDLSPVCRKSTVAGSFDFVAVDIVAVDIVAKVEHV